jgi:ribosomal protein L11 methylase PrmA
MTDVNIIPASYKDPAGFVFTYNQQIYRQVNKVYEDQYNLFLQSGLYKELTERKFLLRHQEVENINSSDENCYKTLFPEQLEFISYPYEWSFDMLKDAALLTLDVNIIAIKHGMILKDATPFNVQFQKTNPLFIDTLSFEKYDETKPWVAYRQFCECLLFPLYLSHFTKTDAQKWLMNYPDGITVEMTASLLPIKSWFKLGTWLHVYLHQKISRKQNNNPSSKLSFSKQKLVYLLDGLYSTIKNLSFDISSTWSNYYSETILSSEYLIAKEKIFLRYLEEVTERTAIDLGSNDGYFSQLAAVKLDNVIAIDFDSNCINQLYRLIKKNKTGNILPLVIDITNPSPGIGLANEERISFLDRTKPSLVLALAIVHHLSISKNIPLSRIASFFSKISTTLIIEFVPKEDPKVQDLLKTKVDIFLNYTESFFEQCFYEYFNLLKKETITGTKRILYLMQKKS